MATTEEKRTKVKTQPLFFGIGDEHGMHVCLQAVALMTDWLRQHQDNPYPNDDEKEALIASTRLTMNQINYWFTNARRRLLPKWTLQRQIEEQDRKLHGKTPSQSADHQPREDVIVL